MTRDQYILTIAGLDPCSGAGLTADIKTFQAFGLYGLSVCTAVTVQNDIAFKAAYWVDLEVILQQIDTLFERFTIEVVKIGMVKNWEALVSILEQLYQYNPTIKVVLDPVLKASAGYDFHSEDDLSTLDTILERIYLITPNYEEIQSLYAEKSIKETIAHISSKTKLYLKGGHRENSLGLDELYYNKTMQQRLMPSETVVFPKHGSGCVLSSALASTILLGYPIEAAALQSKKYIEQFLSSNKTLLGDHFPLSSAYKTSKKL